MAYINKQDTNGTKSTLLKGELGYDDYTAGGDTGRVYVGNGTENIPLSKESEVYKKEEVAQALGNLSNPLLDLPLNNSLAMKQGVGSVTYSRATTATYIDRYGVLKYASIDEPRFEKDGLLIEGASTNYTLYSNDFSNAVWGKTAVTVNTSTEEWIDGVGTFSKLDATSATGVFIQNHISRPAGTYTTYFFVKQGDAPKVAIAISGAGVTFDQLKYDFGLDTIVLANNSGTASAKRTIMKNGVVRLEITVTTNALSIMSSRIYPLGNDVATTGYCYAKGAQLEQLPFASSYIPTTTTAVTRSADVCSVTFANNFPADLASMSSVIDIKMIGTSGTFKRFFNTGSFALFASYAASNDNKSYVYKATESQVLTPVVMPTDTFRYGAVFDIDNTSLTMYYDGAQVGQDTTASTSNANNGTIVVGNSSAYLYVKNIKIYDKALTATEIALA